MGRAGLPRRIGVGSHRYTSRTSTRVAFLLICIRGCRIDPPRQGPGQQDRQLDLYEQVGGIKSVFSTHG